MYDTLYTISAFSQFDLEGAVHIVKTYERDDEQLDHLSLSYQRFRQYQINIVSGNVVKHNLSLVIVGRGRFMIQGNFIEQKNSKKQDVTVFLNRG